ncbi:hypothetical protein FOA52_013556 [Chlamydomonas sp. UWO 241]|nr:hypothetical protein FOA52_013556 [Chlamydomonas sp. UWO 241]
MFAGLFGGAGKAEARGTVLAPKEAPPGLKLATFAGGCFWGIELAYQRVPGVTATSVGYTQGQKLNPTYEEVCSGSTGHTEAIQCTFDEKECTYDQLLDLFFDRVDPTSLNRQGNDRGTQYRSGIYYHDDAQKAVAIARVAEINEKLQSGAWGKFTGSKCVVEVLPAGDYYLAEKYHQQYLSKGGRGGQSQSAAKNCTDKIRCYG